jgi:hypothetical protein
MVQIQFDGTVAMGLIGTSRCVIRSPAQADVVARMKRRPPPPPPSVIHQPATGFAGFRLPPEVILCSVQGWLRYGLSYCDLEELLAERGVKVDQVTLYRWVQRFTPILVNAAGPCRHAVGPGAEPACP